MEEIEHKLNAVLSRLGMDTNARSDTISFFRKKLELLSETKKYNGLLKSLFASNNLSEFNSYVFEALFAYDFQSKKQSLTYEVTPLTDSNSSVDFYYELDDFNIYFELRLVQQKNEISKSIETQLATNNSYEIQLNGEDEARETIRLQNLILSKCQRTDGTPIKFKTPEEGTLNFIVINLSELHLGMIDKLDCLLTMYGDKSVPSFCRLGIFGMWQDLIEISTKEEKALHEKFQYFRETIAAYLNQ